jgi:hypothetical protein
LRGTPNSSSWSAYRGKPQARTGFLDESQKAGKCLRIKKNSPFFSFNQEHGTANFIQEKQPTAESKQMEKPRPAPKLVFVFSSARS